MLKLKASEHDHPADSWCWIANTLAFSYINTKLESLHNSWILLIKVLKDYKSFKILIKMLNRLEKILVL